MKDKIGNGWDGRTFNRRECLDEAAVRRRVSDEAYVYVLCRPDGQPFYVGKGVNSRVLQHVIEARTTKRLTHKLNVIRAIERAGDSIRYVIDSIHKDEAQALLRERELIGIIGRYDLGQGPLTNQTDGGEGTANPSEESRQRRRESLWGSEGEDAERNLANRWFQTLASVRSVPLKPVFGRYRIEGLTRNRASLSPTDRQAGALAASAILNRVMLEPGALLPRRVKFEDSELIIENGVGRDILSSGMAELAESPVGYEVLRLSNSGFRFVRDAIDHALLIEAGVLDPMAEPTKGT